MPLPPSDNTSVSDGDLESFLGDTTDDKVINTDNDNKDIKSDTNKDKDSKDDKETIELVDEDDDDSIDLDDKDDKNKDKKNDKKDIDDEDLDDDDEDENKDEDKDEDDEIEVDAPPKRKELLAKYPKIFKDFPYLNNLLYRDREIRERFGSFDDIEEFQTKASRLDEFAGDLEKGSIENTIKMIKGFNEKAYNKLVDDYLPTLFRVDKEAYREVSLNVINQAVREMANRAREDGDEDLLKIAAGLNKHFFGSTTLKAPTTRASVNDKSEDETDIKQREFLKQRYESTESDLQKRVDNTLKATIEKYIDPQNEMTAYLKKNAVKDALALITKNVSNDAGFRRTLDKLWKDSFTHNFDDRTTKRIRSAYLGRAKQVLKAAITKSRAKALNGLAPSDKSDDNVNKNRGETSRRIPAGRPHQNNSGDKLKMKPGESVIDFLNRD